MIKAKSDAQGWNVDLAGLARIWKGGCIIRAGFLDRIKSAYQKDPKLDSLLLDEGFAKDLVSFCLPTCAFFVWQLCGRSCLCAVGVRSVVTRGLCVAGRAVRRMDIRCQIVC